MTGYTVHTGSSIKFSTGWDQIFGKPSRGTKAQIRKPRAAKKSSKKPTAAKRVAKPISAKRSGKRAAGKKARSTRKSA